ncbi:hypothetical protein Goshw_000871, partial [Gossypium schwendimanii]|nr:hypothetical protein [Gossypium schwendimanii]
AIEGATPEDRWPETKRFHDFFTFSVGFLETSNPYLGLERAVNVTTFLKKLMSITGMSEQWVTARIKQKLDSKYIPWKSLKDSILTHPDVRKKVDVFALSIFGLVIFSKALGHVDEVVTDLFDRLDKRVTLILKILAETFRSLSACQKAGEGRFIGCAQLLIAWRDDISEEKWMAILQNLQEEDVEWRALWLLSDEILYRCGNFDWVPLLGIWGAIGYAPLLVLKQYRSRQFIPTTQGIVIMKRLAVGPMTTLEYNEWWKFQEVLTRNEASEKSLSESQKEKCELKDRVTELERYFR